MIGEDDRRTVSLRFNKAARFATFARYARMEAGVDPEFDDVGEFIEALGKRRYVAAVEVVAGESGDGLRAFIARHPQFWDEKKPPVAAGETKAARAQREYEAEEYTRRRAKEHESALAWAVEEERREAIRIAEQSERLRAQLMASNRPLRLPTPAEVAAAEARARERQRVLDEARAAAQRKAEAGIAYWREYYEQRAREQARAREDELNRVA